MPGIVFCTPYKPALQNYLMRRYRFLLHSIIVCLLLVPCRVWGQESRAVTGIEEELWYYDKAAAAFLPYFESQTPDPNLLAFYLRLKGEEDKVLKICGPAGMAIWVGQQLIIAQTGSECYEAALSDWRRQFGRDSVFVTLHAPTNIIDHASVSLVSSRLLSLSATDLTPGRRSSNAQSQFLFLFAFIFLAIISVYRHQFPRIFRSFLDVSRMLSTRGRDDLVAGFRLLSAPSLVSHALVSLLSGFFLCLFYFKSSPAEASPTLLQYFERWLLFSLMMLAFFLGKRLLIQVFGAIFKLSGATYTQVYEYLRGGFLLLSVGLFIFLPFFYLNSAVSAWLLNNLPLLAAVFTCLIILLLFYKLAFETRYQKLHLFSYLCATETLPAILLLKWMFF